MSELAIPDNPSTAVAPVHTAADWELSPSTIARIERAPAANTLTAYNRWIADWNQWCQKVGRRALPATPQTLAEYVSHLADRNKGIPTIRIAVAAVRFQHAGAGYGGQPVGKLAELVKRAHSRDRIGEGNRGGQATPIVIDDLHAMVDTCAPDTLRGLRDRLVLVLGWSGMLRRSELAALTFRDITQTADGIHVYIASSKTDQDGKGATVPIPFGSHPETDPARVWQAYVAALAERDITSGPLIRAVDKGGKVGPNITGYAINTLVRDAAVRAKLPNADGYTAHSLRAGGATAAYKAGATVSAIAEHGRWAKNSPVVLGYIRSVDKWKDNPMRGIGL